MKGDTSGKAPVAVEVYLGVGTVLLESINDRRTVSQLWDAVRGRPEIGTFGRFVLGLDMLFIFGLIDIGDDGVIARKRRARR